MRMLIGALSVAALVASTGSGFAQGNALVHNSFESNEESWVALGENTKVGVTNTTTNVKAGKGSLQYSYTIAKGGMGAAILPVNPPALAKMKSIRLWIKSDQSTTLIVSIQERNGGRYMAGFNAPKDEWQKVELSASDFNLNEGPNDPKDPNGKLDLDQVENVAIGDIGQFLAQGDAAIVDLFGIKLGAHNVYLDEFEISEDALPSSSTTGPMEVALDTFAHPQVAWMGVGGIKLSQAAGKIPPGKALQVDYKQQAGKIAGLVRSIKRGNLDGMKTINVSVVSAKACKLLIQVEESGGGKYNTMVDVPGGNELKKISVPFSEMGAADDSKDSNGKLDAEQINQLVIIDIYGIAGIGEGDNTLWIGNVKASK